MTVEITKVLKPSGVGSIPTGATNNMEKEKLIETLISLTERLCEGTLKNIDKINKIADEYPEFKNSQTYLNFLDELNKISVRY